MPAIAHEADGCWPEDQFPRLAAGIQPGDEVLTAKVYFRSDKYPDFYYVVMQLSSEAEDFRAILPMPGPETDRVIYYMEAIDRTFSGARTEEYEARIEDPCRRRAPAFYTGENPEIVVGATKAGSAPLPPGFQAAGIVGVISAAGVSAGVGGGVGVGTAVVAAGAAAAAGGAVVVAGGGEASTTIPPSGPPSTTSAPSPPNTTIPPATTTTIPGTTSTTSAPSTTTSVRTTTTTSAPSTTSSTTSTAPTTSTSTTTSSSTTTTIAAPPVSACLTATKENSCVWRFDASCSTGPIVQYDWLIDPGGNMPAPRPPVNQSGQVVIVDWNPPSYGGCSGSPTITVQLTVVGSLGQTDVVSHGPSIDLRGFPEREEISISFTSFLGIASDGESRGFIVWHGDRRDLSSPSVTSTHRFRGFTGRNTVEAYTEAHGPAEGFWKFDFASAMHFVPGSLAVETGSIASVDGRSIVFRLTGTAGERIRFTFELSR